MKRLSRPEVESVSRRTRIAAAIALGVVLAGCGYGPPPKPTYTPIPDRDLFAAIEALPGVTEVEDLSYWEPHFGYGDSYNGTVVIDGDRNQAVDTLDRVYAILRQGRPGAGVSVQVGYLLGSQSAPLNGIDVGLQSVADLNERYGPQPGTGIPPSSPSLSAPVVPTYDVLSTPVLSEQIASIPGVVAVDIEFDWFHPDYDDARRAKEHGNVYTGAVTVVSDDIALDVLDKVYVVLRHGSFEANMEVEVVSRDTRTVYGADRLGLRSRQDLNDRYGPQPNSGQPSSTPTGTV